MAKGEVIRNMDTLMKSNYDIISMGIKPSGEIHLGSVTTILIGLSYISEHPDSLFDIRIMDLDYDRRLGKNFTPYLHRFSDKKQKTAREGLREELTDFVELAAEKIPNLRINSKFEEKNVEVGFFSELMFTPKYVEFFSNLLTDKETLKIINQNIFKYDSDKKLPVSGICPSCYKSSPNPAKQTFDPEDYQKIKHRLKHVKNSEADIAWDIQLENIMKFEKQLGEYEMRVDSIVGGNPANRKYVLTSKCFNKDCETKDYHFDMRTTPANIHYMVDPLRDSIIAENKSIIHLYGGDYGLPIRKDGSSRADVIIKTLDDLDLHPVDAFVGPLIKYEGQKMGKSGKYFSFNELSYSVKVELIETMLHHVNENKQEIHWKDIKF